jgi:hypothetical protein
VVFTVAPNGDFVFVELRDLKLYKLTIGADPVLLVTLTTKPDSLAVTRNGMIWAAGREPQHHRLRIWFAGSLSQPEMNAKRVIEPFRPGVNGPASRFPVHLRIAADGTFVVGWSHNLMTVTPGRPYERRVVVSNGWTDPVFAFGRGERIWVADNALPGQKERLARGRDKSIKHRNRFATVMPAYTNPSGMVLIEDELLICSRTHHKVYRLHIGLDDVAHWRGLMGGLLCDRDIGVAHDGSLITAQTSAIYKYPPRA